MIDNLITNVSSFAAEMWVVMTLGLGWCALMIFAPQVMRGIQDGIGELFGNKRIEGHPLQSLAFYRFIGVVVFAILAYAAFSTPKPEPTPPQLPPGLPFKIGNFNSSQPFQPEP